ncbi:hypothetical protein F5878DRAFT_35939 [Lentinula raphanica]|uniref:trans-L-3-hydroxyproline dehydratase n=1 Tax=Lentinula raphanica TaxID=153919 RepID=A0AA38UN10_9AGAR|nr:hypothetical protein F5878DRAFT_35939 [Lentinula raphanica]
MDVFQALANQQTVIRTVDMHTSGEPTRIIISGFPDLKGSTLLDKRRYASENPEVDRVRKWLMLEPRGHPGMYGAILVKETELTRSGEADIGVLFCHNEGYSTMCGHATIALGRFLIDTWDLDVFPQRPFLQQVTSSAGSSGPEARANENVTIIRLHVPCGVVTVSVPTPNRNTEPGLHKPVRFKSVPCFVPSTPSSSSSAQLPHTITVTVPRELAWPRLIAKHRSHIHDTEGPIQIHLNISYGGAFYALVSSSELGFPSLRVRSTSEDSSTSSSSSPNSVLKELEESAQILRVLLEQDPNARKAFSSDRVDPDVRFLYGVTIIDSSESAVEEKPRQDEGKSSSYESEEVPDQNENENEKKIIWICFFGSPSSSSNLAPGGGSQIDRSPTGSCVSAHVPLAIQQHKFRMGEWCTYESFLSVQFPGNGFRGRAVERVPRWGGRIEGSVEEYEYIIEVEGYAYYTGSANFVVPEGWRDTMGGGFEVKLPSELV